MTYAQCPKCHARLRVPDARQSLRVRCPGCSHSFQTRPGAREEASPTSARAGGKRPLVKWMLAAWAIAAVGAAGGVVYLLATDTGPTKASVPDEPAPPATPTDTGATPLVGASETGGESDVPGTVIPAPPSGGIDETQYDKKPPAKPRKPRKKKGRGGRKKGTPAPKPTGGKLEKTDISAPRK
jgi:predicted Zn finger-like uncharacterized protein